MTRLSKHKKKEFYSQLIFYFLVLILIIVFVSTIGLRLLLNTSVYVAQLLNRERQAKTSSSEDLTYLASPQIYDIPTATNSALAAISGFAPSGNNLSVFVNGQKQKEVVSKDDSFETEINLKEEENSVFVELENAKTGEKRKSRTYKILYKSEKPMLEVISPTDGFETNELEIEVVGKTEKEVFVRINDLPVVVDSEGNFSYSVKLIEGENKITVEAIDIAGNVERREVIVFYQKEE